MIRPCCRSSFVGRRDRSDFSKMKFSFDCIQNFMVWSSTSIENSKLWFTRHSLRISLNFGGVRFLKYFSFIFFFDFHTQPKNGLRDFFYSFTHFSQWFSTKIDFRTKRFTENLFASTFFFFLNRWKTIARDLKRPNVEICENFLWYLSKSDSIAIIFTSRRLIAWRHSKHSLWLDRWDNWRHTLLFHFNLFSSSDTLILEIGNLATEK